MKKIKEQTKNSERVNQKKNIGETIGDAIYLIIIIPLLIITLSVIYQSITKPDEVPDIFGYKLFMILQENMDETLKYGDLTFTRNISTNELKIGDIVAFRNSSNTVELHKIEGIQETTEHSKKFIMKLQEGIIDNENSVDEDKIEGILVTRIPKIGLWLMIFQRPIVLLSVIGVILVIGLIAYVIAWKLDKKDMEKETFVRAEKISKEDKTKKVKALK